MGFQGNRFMIQASQRESLNDGSSFLADGRPVFAARTDDRFSRLEPHLPTDTRGKPRVDDQRVISGIIHVLKSGCRWVDAPPAYGPRKTLYNRFVRWADKGIWQDIFHALASAGGPPAQVLIDSSAVKAHRYAAGGKGGKSAKRLVAREVVERRRSTR